MSHSNKNGASYTDYKHKEKGTLHGTVTRMVQATLTTNIKRRNSMAALYNHFSRFTENMTISVSKHWLRNIIMLLTNEGRPGKVNYFFF